MATTLQETFCNNLNKPEPPPSSNSYPQNVQRSGFALSWHSQHGTPATSDGQDKAKQNPAAVDDEYRVRDEEEGADVAVHRGLWSLLQARKRSMVGADGWCVNFDKGTRKCLIYNDRPYFCRVEAEVFQSLYGINEKKFNKEACRSCRDTIKSVYGPHSKELVNFNSAVTSSSSSNSC
ncbi:hypothetical protein Prudu_017610 [Prunus dulcis]|uniref:Uncharacterized protein n=1 Tax=Prunus dulcis TaxID=3755 RepID=A0A4Y1RNY7_PRUDU|nr:hypothetical protein Prudu_017610 [Prunus dulcis]